MLEKLKTELFILMLKKLCNTLHIYLILMENLEFYFSITLSSSAPSYNVTQEHMVSHGAKGQP